MAYFNLNRGMMILDSLKTLVEQSRYSQAKEDLAHQLIKD
jgi:hypothetical protein